MIPWGVWYRPSEEVNQRIQNSSAYEDVHEQIQRDLGSYIKPISAIASQSSAEAALECERLVGDESLIIDL